MSARHGDAATLREASTAVVSRSTPRTSLAGRLNERVGSDEAAALGLFALALIVGSVTRILPLSWGKGFPLNDGGMFYAMVEDIKASGLGLPEFTSYNGGHIPFAYSPLPFYTAAALSDVFGVSTLDILRFLPATFSLLTLGAFFLLARSMLPSRTMAGVAVLLLAVVPRSFNWEIVGGGLTRSPALFFGVLALWQGYELLSTQKRQQVLTTAFFSALTILCHMEMGVFLVFSLGLFVFARAGLRRNLGVAMALCALVPVLTAPWWLETLLRVGPDPMLAAMRTGAHSPLSLLRFLTMATTEEPFFPVFLVFGLLGLANRLRARDYLLPLWLALIFVLDPRKAATISTLPLALLGSWGLTTVVWPLLQTSDRVPRDRLPSSRWSVATLAFLLLLYAPAAAIGSASRAGSPLFALASAEREAMAWAKDNTASDARFLVLPLTRGWAIDAPAEWFPALTQRVSISTVQGTEWLPDGRFAELDAAHDALLECTYADAACLDAWAAGIGERFDYVYVPRANPPLEKATLRLGKSDCCAELRAALSQADSYRQVFAGPGASIYERLR